MKLCSSANTDTDRYPYRGSEVVYAIITRETFRDELEPLRSWKTEKGVPAEIYTVETELALVQGADLAEKIHEFLVALKEQCPELTWVLLVGDSNLIPIRELYAGSTGGELDTTYPSDYYYAGLGSNWDLDQDGIYGEPGEEDWSPNVYVGRLPVNTEAEVTRVVDRILTYEQAPPAGDWIKTFELWGAVFDAPNSAEYDAYKDNAYEIKHLRISPEIPTYMNINELYDYSQIEGGYYTTEQDLLNQANIIAHMDAGASCINFAGHATNNGNKLVQYGGTGDTWAPNDAYIAYTYEDASAVLNGYKLPLFYIASCYVGNFTEVDDTNLERLLTAPNGGVIGLVAPTGSTYRGEYPGNFSEGNWWLDERFWSLFFDATPTTGGMYQPGRTLYELKFAYATEILAGNLYPEAIKSNLYAYNLLGDPEISIWTDTPRALEVSSPQLYTGTHEVEFYVTDDTGMPVANARVCLQNSEIYEYGVTDLDGIATITISASQPAQIDLTVTAHNFLPHIATLNIIEEPADLTITSTDINFVPGSPFVGTIVKISAAVHNEGSQIALNVMVHVFDGHPDEDGLLIAENISAGDIPVGGNSKIYVDWVATPGTHTIYVVVDPSNLIMEIDETNNIASAEIRTLAPDLQIANADIEFVPSDIVSTYSEVTIVMTVCNIDVVDADNVNLSVSAYSSTGELYEIIGNLILAHVYAGESVTASISWIPELYGEFIIEVVVDPENEIIETLETNNIAMKPIVVNEPPIFLDIPDLMIEEDSIVVGAINLLEYVIDPDNKTTDLEFDIVEYNPAQCDLWLIEQSNIALEPVTNWSGTSHVTISVSDGIATTMGYINVNVTPINDAPVLIPIADQILNETELYHYQLIAIDSDDTNLTFEDDTELFDIDPDTGEIIFTPSVEHIGIHYVNISVRDDDGLADTITIIFYINNIYDPPVLQPVGKLTAIVGELFKYQINGTIDPGLTPPGAKIFSDNTELFDIDPTTGLISFRPTDADVGTHRVTISLTDGITAVEITFIIDVKYKMDEQPPAPDTDGEPKDKIRKGAPGQGIFGFGESPLVDYAIFGIIIGAVIITVIVYLYKRRRRELEHLEKIWRVTDRVDAEIEYVPPEQRRYRPPPPLQPQHNY